MRQVSAIAKGRAGEGRAVLIPSQRLIALALALLPVAVAASLWPDAAGGALAALTVLALLLALVDAGLVLARARPRFARRAPHAFALGVEREVALELAPADGRALRAELFDHVPAAFAVTGLPLALRAARGAGARGTYRVRPLARGDQRFAGCSVRIDSPLGLWQRGLVLGEADQVKVFPNFAALARYALAATDHRLSQLGVLKRRRRGQGLEFHQLREYREGDAERQIDWKASARTGRLISREYQDERDQQILLVIDTGRRMAARDGELGHLDHVLNAAMLLAHAAIRQGDAVGLATLGGARRWLAPRKSRAMLNALLGELYDLEPTLATPDFHTAAVEIMTRLRKRALVVILTNLRDEDDESLAAALRLLRQRHLVLVASLRETILDTALAAPVATLDDALTHAATAQYLEQRAEAFRRLEAARVPAVDVEPAALPLALVNRYLELKRSGRM